MKALFIGGTGTISMAITRMLAAHPDWELTLLNRGTRNGDLPAGVRTVTADISDEAAATKALEGMTFDCVCDFIAFEKAQLERDFRLFAGIHVHAANHGIAVAIKQRVILIKVHAECAVIRIRHERDFTCFDIRAIEAFANVPIALRVDLRAGKEEILVVLGEVFGRKVMLGIAFRAEGILPDLIARNGIVVAFHVASTSCTKEKSVTAVTLSSASNASSIRFFSSGIT